MAGLALVWLLAAAWGSVVQTQFMLQALKALGVDGPSDVRALTTWQPLVGFGPVYGGTLAAGWMPALAGAAILARRFPEWRSSLLAAAGGLGLIAAVRAIDAVAPMPVFIDATRGLPGLLALTTGSVVAGLIYSRLTRPQA